MGNESVGYLFIMVIVTIVMLSVTIYRVTIGMTIAAFFLAITGFVFFAVARGGVHEATGGIFIIGGAICGGIAGAARKMNRPSS